MHNLKQTLIAFDQLIYCLIGTILSIFNHKIKVYADLTISAQSYRLADKGKWYGKAMRFSIDLLFRIFERDHCHKAYLSEKQGTHLPNDIKD